MPIELIINLLTALSYAAILVYYTFKHRKYLLAEREIYTSVFEKAMDTLGDSHIRVTQRMHFLNTCDWAYARGTHQNLLGLSFLLPSNILESPDPIDIVKYYTDDEVEAIVKGIEVFKKDKRTSDIVQHFKLPA